MPDPIDPALKAKALEIYREHGPAEAARQTGLKRGSISSWAKRAGLTSPNAERTKAAMDAASQWKLRRVKLRDLSGEAAEEFLAEARAKMTTNARAATDHMRSFSIAVTTANTLAAQTAGEPGTQNREEFDAEVDKMIGEMMSAAVGEMMSAAEKKARQELLDEMNGTRESTGGAATPPATAGHVQVPYEERQNGAPEVHAPRGEQNGAPVDWGEPNGDEPPSELDLRIRYGEWVP